VSRHSSQEVCPWNGPKFVSLTREPDFNGRERDRERERKRIREQRDPLPDTSLPSLVALLETALDEAEWDAFSRGSAMRRSGRAGFARNVCVALGNWGSPEAVPVLVRAISDPEPLVRAHAAWALGRVGSAEARAARSDRTSVETDASVREELSEPTDA
jgi:epoxyqueuosine reductase